jgi:hypothetical protein
MLLKCQQRPCADFGTGFFVWWKGDLIMEHNEAMAIINVIKMEESIRWHLEHECNPPVPSEMIPIAMKAIMLCREDKFNESLIVPFEEWFGWMVPAYVVVETYHLEPWVNELEVY